MKVVIWSTFAQQTLVRKNILKTEIDETESAINKIKKCKIEYMNKNDIGIEKQIIDIDIDKKS
jgi:hypothetical protein